MDITQVHAQKLISLGNYENERLGAWANVEPGEEPEDAIAKLRKWVDQQLGSTAAALTTLEETNFEIGVRGNELRRLEMLCELARKRWDAAKGFIIKLGLDVPQQYEDDIPF